ncbi:membrane protein DedA with SNARE-associated domain [Thermocatellispora tengchongensis]|uniref:Membrane protein DedA with SNARE-associated domain n=1 Tax=Thermocatellispora tengchongensis TaxID=1073253 RepID=A0A840PFA4_9ACTN|nr:VTT domain-containing protein [Thermocatellispora tengchongensis]MBB5136521.1 membrane protein DedA with SNARE-associated domain [Thermocatellispora tengchongensis]
MSGTGLSIPAPTEASLFGLPLWLVVAVGAVALFGAFQVYYWVGHFLGERLYASRVGTRIGRHRIRKVENVVRRWGALAVYACFWVPVLRHSLPWVAGVLRVSYPWYVVASALGCLTWVPVTSFGLYTVIWGWVGLASRSPITAAVVAVAALAALAGVTVWRRRRKAAPDDKLASA